MRTLAYSLLLLSILNGRLPGADNTSDASAWKPLFDGKTLDGWVQRGGNARYRVEAGQIIGSCVPNTPNSFLCTVREFTNFVLELEFKVDTGLNSGVQIRSHSFDAPTEFVWKERKSGFPPAASTDSRLKLILRAGPGRAASMKRVREAG
jgi:hypothetical protein